MVQCLLCGYTFIPGLKNPNVCGNCYRRVAAERHKAGLRRIPNTNKKVIEERKREKKKFYEWYREEMESDSFGKKYKFKFKRKQSPMDVALKETSEN